ncbi:MAG: hypothetical protein M1828_000779 [Chrysothrix sp. TS-e1954]|nr:MAG: hypothetical protein M1828_000779 [Chrysothrix sp. TS-e1954]
MTNSYKLLATLCLAGSLALAVPLPTGIDARFSHTSQGVIAEHFCALDSTDIVPIEATQAEAGLASISSPEAPAPVYRREDDDVGPNKFFRREEDSSEPEGFFRRDEDDGSKPEGIFFRREEDDPEPQGFFRREEDSSEPEGFFRRDEDDGSEPEGIFFRREEDGSEFDGFFRRDFEDFPDKVYRRDYDSDSTKSKTASRREPDDLEPDMAFGRASDEAEIGGFVRRSPVEEGPPPVVFRRGPEQARPTSEPFF